METAILSSQRDLRTEEIYSTACARPESSYKFLRLLRTDRGTPRPTPRRCHSPYRNPWNHHDELDEEVLNLVKQFNERVISGVGRRARDIIKRYRCCRFLGNDDRVLLQTTWERCHRFMHSLERSLETAVAEDRDMNQAVARFSFQAWSDCNIMCAAINGVLCTEKQHKRSPTRRSLKGQALPSSLSGAHDIAI